MLAQVYTLKFPVVLGLGMPLAGVPQIKEDSKMSIEVAAVIQRIIRADVGQAQSILAGQPQEIREEIIQQFRSNQKLRYLFPEFVEVVLL